MKRVKNNKNLIYGVLVIAIFFMSILSVTFYINYKMEVKRAQREKIVLENNPNATLPNTLIREQFKQGDKRFRAFGFFILPTTALIGTFVGALTYYLMSEKLETTTDKLEVNTNLILTLLNSDERKIVKKIIQEKGSMHQVELKYVSGMNKVKVHRHLKKLEERGIVSLERLGKINKVILKKELYEVLKD